MYTPGLHLQDAAGIFLEDQGADLVLDRDVSEVFQPTVRRDGRARSDPNSIFFFSKVLA